MIQHERSQYTLAQMRAFVAERVGLSVEKVGPDSDIDEALGCTGDDFDELMIEYHESFGVNMDTYLWYFHTTAEGDLGFGALFRQSPSALVSHIPVTPALLLRCTQIGYWDVEYPPHQLPQEIRHWTLPEWLRITISSVVWGLLFLLCAVQIRGCAM